MAPASGHTQAAGRVLARRPEAPPKHCATCTSSRRTRFGAGFIERKEGRCRDASAARGAPGHLRGGGAPTARRRARPPGGTDSILR